MVVAVTVCLRNSLVLVAQNWQSVLFEFLACNNQ